MGALEDRTPDFRLAVLAATLILAGCVPTPNGQQAIAGASACAAHGGVKFHWGKYDRKKFLVTCVDSTEIHGVIKP